MLSSYTRTLRRWWWLLVVLPGIALGVSLITLSRESPVFSAATTVAVAPTTAIENTTDLLRSLETLERRTVVATLAEVVGARDLREEAARRAGLDDGEGRAYRVRGTLVPYTNVIRLDATGPDAEKVAAFANSARGVTQERARDLYRIYALRTLAEAEIPRRPIRPDPERSLTVALVAGIGIALLVLLVLATATAPPPSRDA